MHIERAPPHFLSACSNSPPSPPLGALSALLCSIHFTAAATSGCSNSDKQLTTRAWLQRERVWGAGAALHMSSEVAPLPAGSPMATCKAPARAPVSSAVSASVHARSRPFDVCVGPLEPPPQPSALQPGCGACAGAAVVPVTPATDSAAAPAAAGDHCHRRRRSPPPVLGCAPSLATAAGRQQQQQCIQGAAASPAASRPCLHGQCGPRRLRKRAAAHRAPTAGLPSCCCSM